MLTAWVGMGTRLGGTGTRLGGMGAAQVGWTSPDLLPEDEHSRYVVTGHTLTSVGWGQGPGLSMEGWMGLGVRLGGGRGGVGSRARLRNGGVE